MFLKKYFNKLFKTTGYTSEVDRLLERCQHSETTQGKVARKSYYKAMASKRGQA